jgi:hypothetical protein
MKPNLTLFSLAIALILVSSPSFADIKPYKPKPQAPTPKPMAQSKLSITEASSRVMTSVLDASATAKNNVFLTLFNADLYAANREGQPPLISLNDTNDAIGVVLKSAGFAHAIVEIELAEGSADNFSYSVTQKDGLEVGAKSVTKVENQLIKADNNKILLAIAPNAPFNEIRFNPKINGKYQIKKITVKEIK